MRHIYQDAVSTPRWSWRAAYLAGALLFPAFLAVLIFLGAWGVSAEVYAASETGVWQENPLEVAEWKTNLVLFCPFH